MVEQMNPKGDYMFVDKRLGEIVSALRTIEDLKGLAEEEFTWLAIHGTERFGDDGDLIFSQGTPPHQLMFILSGDVLVHRHSSSPVSILIGKRVESQARLPSRASRRGTRTEGHLGKRGSWSSMRVIFQNSSMQYHR
jgi:CRP-like cAMP-binding protein